MWMRYRCNPIRIDSMWAAAPATLAEWTIFPPPSSWRLSQVPRRRRLSLSAAQEFASTVGGCGTLASVPNFMRRSQGDLALLSDPRDDLLQLRQGAAASLTIPR